uniref:Uncharacterized protein n=1 Tax=Lutzomyia longipalpis TaxID=7200 RepID=A0A1B0CTK3_LUTLO
MEISHALQGSPILVGRWLVGRWLVGRWLVGRWLVGRLYHPSRCSVISLFCCYRHYQARNLTSMNFDNPVYRKTTEDTFQIEKHGMHGHRIGDEVRALSRECAVSAQEPLNKPGTNDFV